MESFKWLQFSDLHLSSSDPFNMLFARDQLLDCLKREQFVCDYVFITGDVADRGKYPSEKDIEKVLTEVNASSDNVFWIEKILAEVSVPRDNVFWSVGNHDVRRGLVVRKRLKNKTRNAKKPSSKIALWSMSKHEVRRGLAVRNRLIKKIRKSKNPSSEYIKTMSNNNNRKILTKNGMIDYITWYNKFCSTDSRQKDDYTERGFFPDDKAQNTGKPSGAARFCKMVSGIGRRKKGRSNGREFGRETVPPDQKKRLSDSNISDAHIFYPLEHLNLVVLNTCLTSCDGEDPEHLMISEQRLLDVFKSEHKIDKPFFVIGHHGKEFFHPEEQLALTKLFDARNVDFYLCGHSHQLGYAHFSDTGHNIHQITCGGGTWDNYSVFSFIYGEYDAATCTVRITPYSYSDKSAKKWSRDYKLHPHLSEDNNTFVIDRLLDQTKDLQKPLWPAASVMGAFILASFITQKALGFNPKSFSFSVTILGLVFALCYIIWTLVKNRVPIK